MFRNADVGGGGGVGVVTVVVIGMNGSFGSLLLKFRKLVLTLVELLAFSGSI